MAKTFQNTRCDYCGSMFKCLEEYMIVQFRKKGLNMFMTKRYCKVCFKNNACDSLLKFDGIFDKIIGGV